ncbi:MAG: hypothetical protein GXP09_02525 [Gammaproteobacteria bacterium]|nr:hypothetical protein [Gammaproteobacteria bacterium]
MIRKRNPIIILCLGLVLLAGCGYSADKKGKHSNKRITDAGVVLPEYKGSQSGRYTTRIDRRSHGAVLQVSKAPVEAWETLIRALHRFGVPVLESNATSRTVTTEWISMRYNPVSGEVSTLPSLLGRISFKGVNLERHRFRFQVQAGSNKKVSSYIDVVDATRQAEIDMSPDSMASFLVWQDRPVQPGAAAAFLARLQGSYESAMVSRLVSPQVSPQQPGRAQVVPAMTMTVTAAPAAPAGKVATLVSAPAEEEVYRPGKVATSTAQAAEKKGGVQASPPQAALPRQAVTDAKLDAQIVVTAKASAPTPVATATGTTSSKWLLVRASPKIAWVALKHALADQEVAFTLDPSGHYALTTVWLRLDYNEKKDALRTPKDGPQWGFNAKGDGVQQHRFQLLVSKDARGGHAYIQARHVGYKEQIDLTPDASITSLTWSERPTQARIADAFLRELRVIVAPK